ncbi:MAG: endonuclease III [Eubacteriales bacterium]|nr:endonuclease III [Eubacteriales bacterium]
MTKRNEQAAEIVRRLHAQYPEADCTLDYDGPWQLMMAAILAAQCTDARVNLITPALFRRYPDAAAMASADFAELTELIRSCGLFRNKAKAMINSSRTLLEHHDGIMPDDIDSLTALPGIGRKIANLILGDYFGIAAIVVDTHCSRISQLLGLTRRTDPPGIEKDLAMVLESKHWILYGHLMVLHGRAVCQARRPDCPNCPVRDLCDYGRDGGESSDECH